MAKRGHAARTRGGPVRGAAPRGSRSLPAEDLLGCALVLSALAAAAALHAWAPELYYRTAQEDEALEWASFWAFALGGGLWVRAALVQRRAGVRLPWFSLGVALFCFFVALEEISWGQRLLGYRPPVYFLAHNFQQELNLHNVAGTGVRVWALRAVLGGYGVLLPLLAALRTPSRVLRRLGVLAPPLALVPGFGAALALQSVYPWEFSGETVEAMLGLGLLFAALAAARAEAAGAAGRGLAAGAAGRAQAAEVAGRGRAAQASGPRGLTALAAAAVLGLGLASAAASHRWAPTDPLRVEQARAEVYALRRDFLSLSARRGGEPPTRCGVHKRIYTFVEQYRQSYLRQAVFSRLTQSWLPPERAEFFLDPWNAPYWVRDECSPDGSYRRAVVYSFGPNRRRDSGPFTAGGDDVVAVVGEQGHRPGG